jgi:hypothetical protein
MKNHQTVINSQFIISHIIEQISIKVEQQTDINLLVKQNMSCYSSNRMMSLVNELNDQLLTLPNN